MMLSSKRFASVGRRCVSSLAENINVNHPRMSIAKNYMKLRRIADATDEAALRAALTDTCTVEQVMNQPDLSDFELYLTTSTTKTYHAPYAEDPGAWQNWSFWRVGWRECQKLEHWSNLVGFACLGWFMAYYVPTTWAATDPDTLRRSGYLSKLEGRMGHIRTVEEHAVYVEEMKAKGKAIF